ncbi:hypothetical protein YC2023_099939 [Brassica napus]
MSLSGIGVPHGVPGDTWVHLELKGGDYSDLWTSTAWSDQPRATISSHSSQSDAMNSLALYASERPPRATRRSRSSS